MGIKIAFTVVESESGSRWLFPATQLDYEELKKIKVGVIYTTEFKETRSYKYHQRFFAMLDVVMQNMDETVRDKKGITTMETFLLNVKLGLGHCDHIWLEDYQQFCLIPKSISFAQMDQEDFEKFYKHALDHCIDVYLAKGSVNPTSWRDFVNDAVYKMIGFM